MNGSKQEKEILDEFTKVTGLLKANVHPLIVSQRLGHADVKTTLNVYSYVLPSLQEAAAKRLDDLLMPITSRND